MFVEAYNEKKVKLCEFLKRVHGHNTHTPFELTEKIVNTIKADENAEVAVLFNIEFVFTLITLKGVDPKKITFFGDCSKKRQLVESWGCVYVNSDVLLNKKKCEKYKMKFDVVVGNPPYKDGTKSGGQNKIYMLFCKKAFELLSDKGTISFVTPASALKQSKRFSLVGTQGLKTVDFTADKHFNEGIKICSWIVDRTYTGDVTVIHNNGENTQSKDIVIYDYSEVDKDFAELYEALKSATDTPGKRMFCQNNFGPAFSKTRSDNHLYPLYKLDKENKVITYWSSRVPYFVNDNKITIGMTKSLNENAIIIGNDNFDLAYMTTSVETDKQVENIKSFILSNYFKKHCEKWKNVDGYGYNYALKYLPPFDKNKNWAEEDVKKFIESYAR